MCGCSMSFFSRRRKLAGAVASVVNNHNRHFIEALESRQYLSQPYVTGWSVIPLPYTGETRVAEGGACDVWVYVDGGEGEVTVTSNWGEGTDEGVADNGAVSFLGLSFPDNVGPIQFDAYDEAGHHNVTYSDYSDNVY